MDGRTREMTNDQRREIAIDVLSQAVMGIALAGTFKGSRQHGRGPLTSGSEELAYSAEERLHVQETTGDGRRRHATRQAEEM